MSRPLFATALNDRLGRNACGGGAHCALCCTVQAVQIDPGITTAWNRYARALMWEDRDEEAVEAFDRAVNLHPAVDSLWQRGLLRLKLRREEEARAWLCKRATAWRVASPFRRQACLRMWATGASARTLLPGSRRLQVCGR